MDGVHSTAAFINKLLEDATVGFQRPGAPEVFVTCSVGVSVFPTDGLDPDLLMRNAGLALRHAKEAGPHHYEFFSPSFNELALRRLDMGAELRRALGRDEIELLYEPRIELSTGRLVGAQAVLRWTHPSGRVVEGDALMDLAGTSEMDVALTEWLFDQVRRNSRTWRAAGMAPLTTGIKASLAHLHPRDLGHLVGAAIAGGIPPRQISLELQHVSQLEGLPASEAAVLAALRKKGVRLALDRFGTTASVGHLRQLACDEIKIAATFVRDLEGDAAVQAMLLGMGDLARRLGLQCVACGVDDGRQLAFLRRNAWDQAQGRIFGEPLGAVPFAARFLARGGKAQHVVLPADPG
jgi:EAL domain-containing protein (putative c-di-GMP-specific phosphodiesterase class I)